MDFKFKNILKLEKKRNIPNTIDNIDKFVISIAIRIPKVGGKRY